MAGLFNTSVNPDTVISPTVKGPFSTVVGSPTVNVGTGIAGNNTLTLPQGSFVGIGASALPYLPVAFAFGFGLSMASAPSALTPILSVTLGASTVTLAIDATGTLTFVAGGAFTVASAGGLLLYNGSRQYIECYLSGIGSSITGTIQYEGTVNGTGTGTTYGGASTFSNFVLGAAANLTSSMIVDSIYLVDRTGSGRNSLLGKRVSTLQISAGVGQFSQMTPNGASLGWQCLSSIPPGGDSIYVFDDTPGDQEAVAMSSPFGLSSVDFVMQRASARQEVGSGGRTIALGIGDGTTVVYGATQNLPTTYTGLNQVWDEDPTTSASWVLGNLASRQAALKTVS